MCRFCAQNNASRQALLSLYMSTQLDFYFYLLNHQNHKSQILPQKASQSLQHDILSLFSESDEENVDKTVEQEQMVTADEI